MTEIMLFVIGESHVMGTQANYHLRLFGALVSARSGICNLGIRFLFVPVDTALPLPFKWIICS
jgi:hypothetical protein